MVTEWVTRNILQEKYSVFRSCDKTWMNLKSNSNVGVLLFNVFLTPFVDTLRLKMSRVGTLSQTAAVSE